MIFSTADSVAMAIAAAARITNQRKRKKSLNMDLLQKCGLCQDKDVCCCFSACGECGNHANYCFECWNNWILSCEGRGLRFPNCPNCRSNLGLDVVEGILGRLYTSQVPATESNGESEDQDHVSAMTAFGFRCCPRCNIWIERVEGCMAMQCLCGERFCWNCGRSSDACDCRSMLCCLFYNNVTGRHEGRHERCLYPFPEDGNEHAMDGGPATAQQSGDLRGYLMALREATVQDTSYAAIFDDSDYVPCENQNVVNGSGDWIRVGPGRWVERNSPLVQRLERR